MNVLDGPSPGTVTTTLSSFENFQLVYQSITFLQFQTTIKLLFATKKATIYIVGEENKFRDQDQWQDYMRQTISTGTSFLDHQFNLESPEQIPGSLFKNYHNPEYEDITKTFPSNQLLNYNLISYPYKLQAPDVSRVGDIRTKFDDENFSAGNTIGLKDF